MKKIILLLLGISAPLLAASRYDITNTKGVYPLYWDAIYTVNVTNAYSTVFEAPPGYLIQKVIIGDSKLFRPESGESHVIVKKVAPDAAKTNMVLILEGPDKMPRALTFELTGEASPRVSNVQFFIPTDRELNSTLEAAKGQYLTQMNQALSDQEVKLKEEVRVSTMKNVTSFRFGEYPEGTSVKELGAKVYLNAILNSGGEGYVYFSTNAEDPNCQVVNLKAVTGKDLHKNVKLIHSYVEKGWTYYVYSTTPFPKTGKKTKYTFKYKVYQEDVEITAKIL